MTYLRCATSLWATPLRLYITFAYMALPRAAVRHGGARPESRRATTEACCRWSLHCTGTGTGGSAIGRRSAQRVVLRVSWALRVLPEHNSARAATGNTAGLVMTDTSFAHWCPISPQHSALAADAHACTRARAHGAACTGGGTRVLTGTAATDRGACAVTVLREHTAHGHGNARKEPSATLSSEGE
jgi:hypothetical protein